MGERTAFESRWGFFTDEVKVSCTLENENRPAVGMPRSV